MNTKSKKQQELKEMMQDFKYALMFAFALILLFLR